MDELRGLDPTVQVRPADRWVDDGDLITSAGVSAGIDMALHLVARLAGPERAEHASCVEREAAASQAPKPTRLPSRSVFT